MEGSKSRVKKKYRGLLLKIFYDRVLVYYP